MDRRAVAAGAHVVIFDRDPKRPWDENVFSRVESVDGKTIRGWGM